MDFSSIEQSNVVFLPGGERRMCLDVLIEDESILENNEQLFLLLNTSDAAVLLNPNMTRIIINNNDGKFKDQVDISILRFPSLYSGHHWMGANSV